ncbi:MAG: ABC transporter substrate-binding protein [Spirulinaceae cyanobacterium]
MGKANRQLFLVIALIICLLGSGCENSFLGNRFGGVREKPLKIGALLPEIKDPTLLGYNLSQAVSLAVEKVNQCGGVNNQPVQLIVADTKADPLVGEAAMNRLVEIDPVVGVVGGFTSSVSDRAVKVAARNQVMLISPASTSPVFTERSYGGYWARTVSTDILKAQQAAKLALEKGFTQVATVAMNNDYGIGFEEEFINAFLNQGGFVTNKDEPIHYDSTAVNLDTEAMAAFVGNSEAVLIVGDLETGSLLLESAYNHGFDKQAMFIPTDSIYSQAFPQQMPKDSNNRSIVTGVLGLIPGANGMGLSEFASFWHQETGEDITPFVAQTWDATMLLMLAAEAAQENTGQGIKSNLMAVANPGEKPEEKEEVKDVCRGMELLREGKAINYQGVSGNVDLDNNGDVVVGGFEVWRVTEEGELGITKFP